MRRPPARLAASLLVVALAACSGGGGAQSELFRAQATKVLLHSSDDGTLPTAPKALVAQVSTARGLRLGLRLLLAQHTLLVGEVLERAEGAGPDLASSAKTLATNTDTLVAAIGLVYGPAGARAFKELWAQHAQFLVQYGIATGTGDVAAKRQARLDLVQYHQDFSLFANTATGLPTDAVHTLVGGHLTDLLGRADANQKGDQARALAATLSGLVEVGEIADALASAIVGQHPDLFPGPIDDATTDLAATVHDELLAQEAVAVAVAHHPDADGLGTSRAFTPSVGAPAADLRAVLVRMAERLRSLAEDSSPARTEAAATATADDVGRWARAHGADASRARALQLLAAAQVNAVGRRIDQSIRPSSTYDAPDAAGLALAVAIAEQAT